MSAAPEKPKMNPTLHVVALLDLLGYGELVKEFQEDLAVIQGIESVFEDALKLMEGIKSAPLGEYSAAWNVIAERITCRLISDTALITMPFIDLPVLSKDMTPTENSAVWLEAFLASVSLFCLRITGKTGYFFRGGIALDQHYESNPRNERNIFIFSKAVVGAAILMKKEQELGTPRILLAHELLSPLQERGKENPLKQDGWVFDEGGHLVLSIYNAVSVAQKGEEKTTRLLDDIRRGIQGQLRKHGHRPGIAQKYQWLIVYHNRQVSERLHRPDLVIPV